jgi:hypothetical protein
MLATAAPVELACRVRGLDGMVADLALPAERHRRIHLGMLHSDSAGYVEIAAGPRPDGGKTDINTRRDPGHYLPGGATGHPDWLERLLELADQEAAKETSRQEVFVGVTSRTERRGNKPYVTESRWLWVDIDQPEELPRLWAFLEQRPAHLVVASGGSGGAHAYWKLDRPLPAMTTADGKTVEWIERANERIINHLGRWETVDSQQRFVGADRACKDRSRVMRLAGTINHKTGAYARILWADFALAPYSVAELVGHLPDMAHSKSNGQRVRRVVDHDDPYKRIAPADYFRRLAGIDVPAAGLVSCPSPDHRDSHPSCKVGADASEGWWCHGCAVGGAIYDLASIIDGGPTGSALRGEDFKRARDGVRATFGEL